MAKKYKHWCDNLYGEEEKENSKKFVIGDMLRRIYLDLEAYLLNDIERYLNERTDLQELAKVYTIDKFKHILSRVELAEITANNANSIYGLYDVDWRMRRELWLKARGYCFETVTQLNHLTNVTLKGTNIQKYVEKGSELYSVAKKIKNIMIADDELRKKHPKPYITIASPDKQDTSKK